MHSTTFRTIPKPVKDLVVGDRVDMMGMNCRIAKKEPIFRDLQRITLHPDNPPLPDDPNLTTHWSINIEISAYHSVDVIIS